MNIIELNQYEISCISGGIGIFSVKLSPKIALLFNVGGVVGSVLLSCFSGFPTYRELFLDIGVKIGGGYIGSWLGAVFIKYNSEIADPLHVVMGKISSVYLGLTFLYNVGKINYYAKQNDS